MRHWAPKTIAKKIYKRIITILQHIRIHHEWDGGIDYLAWGSLIGIMMLAEWWQIVIAWDRFCYPILTQITDSFSCSPLNTSFYTGKTWTDFKKNSEYPKMQHGDVILTLQWHHRLRHGQLVVHVRLFIFYLSHGLVQVCEIEWVKQRKSWSCVRENVFLTKPMNLLVIFVIHRLMYLLLLVLTMIHQETFAVLPRMWLGIPQEID